MSIYQIPYNHKSMQKEAPDHDYYPTVVTSILLHSPKLYCDSNVSRMSNVSALIFLVHQ
jgi:hypothetical protein